MLKLNSRQKRTLIYLWIATAISWAVVYPMKFNDDFGWLLFVPLVVFGFALFFSNKNYSKEYAVLIPVMFLIVFFWGTLPFFTLGNIVFEYLFGENFIVFGEKFFACISAC